MTTTVIRQDNKHNLIAPFVSSLQAAGGHQAARAKALEALPELEIPTTRQENWKYTSLDALNVYPWQAPELSTQEIDIRPYLIPDLNADVLVFVNGMYVPALSSLAANASLLTVTKIDELNDKQRLLAEQHFGSLAQPESDIFTAINTAYATEGLLIHLGRGKMAEKPIHILHLNAAQAPTSQLIRHLWVLDPHASLKIVESYHSLGNTPVFRNQVTEIVAAEGTHVEYVKLQQENDLAHCVDRVEAHIGGNSVFSIYTLTTGGALMRNYLNLNLDGQHIEAHLKGLYLLDGQQHTDNYTRVEHRQPNCYSNELYKGIVSGEATGVFNGRIHVFPQAQKTNAYQSNRNLLLSDTSSVYTKPQLEIYADDVKCSHGATTGRLDEDALFYLRARGIPEAMATQLMGYAFAAEVTQTISMIPLREHADRLIETRFI